MHVSRKDGHCQGALQQAVVYRDYVVAHKLTTITLSSL